MRENNVLRGAENWRTRLGTADRKISEAPWQLLAKGKVMHIRLSVASLYRQDACGRRRPWHKTRVANIKLRGKSRKCASYEWIIATTCGQSVYGYIFLEG